MTDRSKSVKISSWVLINIKYLILSQIQLMKKAKIWINLWWPIKAKICRLLKKEDKNKLNGQKCMVDEKD